MKNQWGKKMKENEKVKPIECNGYDVQNEMNAVIIVNEGKIVGKELLSDVMRFFLKNNPKYKIIGVQGEKVDFNEEYIDTFRYVC